MPKPHIPMDTKQRINDKVWKQGLHEGFNQARSSALTFLEEKYMGEGRPDRGSPEAEAILRLSRELAQHLKSMEPKL